MEDNRFCYSSFNILNRPPFVNFNSSLNSSESVNIPLITSNPASPERPLNPKDQNNNNDLKMNESRDCCPHPPNLSPALESNVEKCPVNEEEPHQEEICRVLLVPYKTKQEIEAASEDFTGCPDDFEIIYLDQGTSVDDLLDYKKAEGFHDVLVVNPCIKSMRYYFCGVCKLKILTLNDMLRHVIAKHFNFRWKCDICEKTFSRASDRKRHFKNVHESNAVRYVCSQCNQVFDDFVERDDHIRLQHDGGKMPVLLDSSMDGTDSSNGVDSGPSSANSSLLITSNICSVCDESFDSYQILDRHRRQEHNSPPLYRCYTCAERFTSRHILRMHRTSSHVIRSCPACKASFKRSIDLKRHFKRAHPQELPNFPSLALDHNEEAKHLSQQHRQAASFNGISMCKWKNVTLAPKMPNCSPSSQVPIDLSLSGGMASEQAKSFKPDPEVLISQLIQKLTSEQQQQQQQQAPPPPAANNPLECFIMANLLSLILSNGQSMLDGQANSSSASSTHQFPPAPLGLATQLLPPQPRPQQPDLYSTNKPGLIAPKPQTFPTVSAQQQDLTKNEMIRSPCLINPLNSMLDTISLQMPSIGILAPNKLSNKQGSSRLNKNAIDYQNRAFQCDVCASRFTRNYHLQRHMRTVHSISEFYKCAHCSAKYGNRINLENHFRSAHARSKLTNKPNPVTSMQPLDEKTSFVMEKLLTQSEGKERMEEEEEEEEEDENHGEMNNRTCSSPPQHTDEEEEESDEFTFKQFMQTGDKHFLDEDASTSISSNSDGNNKRRRKSLLPRKFPVFNTNVTPAPGGQCQGE